MSVSGSFIWPGQHPCVTWGDAHSLCLRCPGSPMSLTQTSHPEYLLSWNVCAGITGSLAKYRCRDEECDGCQCPESSAPAIFTTWLPVANWDEPAGALWSRDHSGPIRGLVTGCQVSSLSVIITLRVEGLIIFWYPRIDSPTSQCHGPHPSPGH